MLQITAASLTALILQYGPHCSRPQAQAISAVILPAAKRRGIDPRLMAAVVLHETGRTCRYAVRRERVGGCSIGPFQVYHPSCEAGLRLYRSLKRAAYRSAYILWLGKRRCLATIGTPWWCKHGWFWGRYNPGSKRWVVSVAKLYQRMRDENRQMGELGK